MHEGILNYLCDGIIPGHFIRAIIVGDFKMAMQVADDINLWILPVYYGFFYNHVSLAIWGDEERVHRHCLSFQNSENVFDRRAS